MTPMKRTALCMFLVLTGTLSAVQAVKVNGYADYRIDNFIVVDGQLIRTTSRTKIDGSNQDARRWSTIPLGYEMIIKGERTRHGYVLAKKIEVNKNEDDQTDKEIKKAFDEIEAHYLKEGRMIRTDEEGKVVEDYGPLHDSGPMVDRVRRIMTTLVPPYIDPADLRVYVVENEEWNAMAAPNFSIYVFSGLLKDMNDDEVAMVLGHELAHASYEHSRRQFEHSSTWAPFAMIAAELAGQAIDSEAAAAAAQQGMLLAAGAWFNGYSRDHEDQADRVGMRYAYEAGYDVTVGPKLWKRFSDKYGDTPIAVNFFMGSHSRSEKRAKDLQKQIEWNGYDRE